MGLLQISMNVLQLRNTIHMWRAKTQKEVLHSNAPQFII